MNREQMRNWSALTIFAIGMGLSSTAPGQAAELLSAARETAVVQKYCGSCHSDALMYGGLSVQHFDAAHPDPTVAAMLLSKLTRGHTPKDVAAAGSAEILAMMKASAMGAAGMGVPDEKTQAALSSTLAQQSKGAYEWNVTSENGTGAQDRALVASIVREKPSVKREGATDSYRLILRCRADNSQGEIKVAWADSAPAEGQLMSVSVDGAPAFQHKVDGGRAQGNGSNGPGATVLKIPLPARSLAISSLFSDGSIVFPFSELSPAARRDLSVCFPKDETAH